MSGPSSTPAPVAAGKSPAGAPAPPIAADCPADTAAIIATEDAWQLPTYSKLPLALVRGEGSYVWDAEGRRYLDMYGGHCVALAGHCHPRLVAAIREQAGRLLFYSNYVYSDVRALAASRVAALAPAGLRRVFFCNSGTEANETALKLARKWTGRKHVISMREGFHGRTLGSLGATGLGKYRDPAYPLPVEHAFVPYGDLPALQAAFAAARGADGRSGVAAVILEPIPSMGGVRVAPDEYFAGLRAACDAAGALLIFDEVQTGFGRTGTLFFGEGAGVRPDLIAAAKGAGGGVPAGVIFVREDISAAVHKGDQGTTFGGGPLACAAMATVAQLIADEDLPGNARRVGGHLAARLAGVKGVVSVGGRGLMLGVNLDRPAQEAVAALRGRGVIAGGCEGDARQIRLLPPLTLSRSEADECAAAFEAVLA